MKDNKRLLIIVAVALLVSLGLLCLVLFSGRSAESEGDIEGNPVLCSVSAGDITAFSFETGGEAKTFRYTDSGWIYAENEALPIAPAFIERTLSRLSVVSASGVVAEGVRDLSPYGLDGAESSISLTADREYRFIFGALHTESGCYYMMEDGGDTVFLGSGELYALCSPGEADFADIGTLPENYAVGSVKRVLLDGAEYTDEALLKEVSALTLKYGGFSSEGITDGRKVSIRYSAATEDSYGTAAYAIDLMVKAQGDYLTFTYGADGIIYRLDKSNYPELAKIIE